MSSQKVMPTPHLRIIYAQMFFTTFTFVVGSKVLLMHSVTVSTWLPTVLLLVDAFLALASVLYLNNNKRKSYVRLSLTLVCIRVSCVAVLIVDLVLPHALPLASVAVATVALAHTVFSLLAASCVHRSKSRTIAVFALEPLDRTPAELAYSRDTLVTNVEVDELFA
ncbi:unnamed protein product [Caenorhabditis auriculariae]|uniref:Transmembrane protein n=1 Tax=Caenorhabditis auriculariae TaxID=2777116 RepID=A0A8S1HH05_9PELO|nr:unnamed protein product [Caenorhabditis auriculariae]